MEEAIPAYLASVAVGEYVLYEDVYEGLEANIPIQIYVRPFELSATAGSFVNLKNILSIYENHWGPYPFSRIGYVSTAKGAMEHAANIAYPYGTINNTTDYEWLYAHELAHMWFGDKTTCSSAADMWLNEGWAVFNEFLYREGLYGTDAYKTEYREVLNDVLHYAHTPQGDGDYYALNAIPQNITYGTTVYDKGALVVHTLRNYLGDEQFFPAIQDYLQMYAYQSASSEDMEQALTTITGTDLHDFFENWVYTPGFPHFEIDSVIRQGDEQMVYVQQKGTGRDFLSSSNHIEITFMDQNRNTWSDTMMVDGRWAQKGMFPPFVPAAVFIDYHEKMSDAAFQQEALVTEPENFNLNDIFMQVDVSAENDTSLLWISHHWAAPDSLKTPIPGLRLSDYRYWKVSGIFSESFQASARFLYDKPNYLDHTLFQDEGEQITLCYRPDQSSEWQELETTQIGPDIIGFLEINNLMPGEYTMAVWEEWVTGMQQKNEKPFIIYPNPADKRATISSPCPVKNIKIYDSKGLLINSFRLNNHGIFKWDTHHLANGIYTLFINCKNGRTISQKVIIQH
jgi:aminopeptidase N